MRFSLISCVHANMPAMEAVLQDAHKMRCERMLCLGDIVGYYDHPRDCLNLVRTNCQACVKGNHEEYCSTPYPLSDFNSRAAERIEWTRGELSSADQRWLRNLPYVLDFADFTIVHASLDEPAKWGYIFDKFAAASHFTKQDLPVCFNGHTHVPAVFQCDGGSVKCRTFTTFSIEPGIKYLVNAGSVGQPRDGRPEATYVIYDLSDRTVELRRVDYPRPSSGGHGVGEPAPWGSSPPNTLKARSDYPERENKTSS